MKRRRLRSAWFGTCLGLAACAEQAPAPDAVPPAAPDRPPEVALRLIAFNDFHGYLDAPGDRVPVAGPSGASTPQPVGGAATLAGAIAALEAGHPQHLVVAAGDLVGASPLDSGLFHDEPAIEALNAMGLDLSSVGNHEFDQGREELLRKQHGGCYPGGRRGEDTCIDGDFPGAHFHYLAANVVDAASGQTLLPPYEIHTLDTGDGRHLGIAFIGLVLKGTPGMVTPSGVAGLGFTDEAEAANALVPQIRAQGVNAIVVLIHQGGASSGSYNDPACPGLRGDILPILDRLDPAIRVVVSGHTHQAYNCRYGGRLLTSAGSYGRYLTAIDLRLDGRDGSIAGVEATNLAVVDQVPGAEGAAAFAPDAAVTALVARYDALAAPLSGRVVGRIAADITRTPLLDAHSGRPGGESALGELVADSELAATRGQGAVAAFINSGGVRADLLQGQISAGEQAGEVTYGEAYNVLPFGNHLVTMMLSGAQLYDLLGEQWGAQGQVRMLQVSRGFGYAWDERRPAQGGKVVPGSLRIGGRLVRLDRNYRIAVADFLAAGGDGYATLKAGTQRVSGGLDIDAFAEYLRRASPVRPPEADRVWRVDR